MLKFATSLQIYNQTRRCSSKCQLGPKEFKVVMVRHGESEWNAKNLFCGWYDALLTEKGQEEAMAAGRAIRHAGFKFDVAYTSLLSRATDTLKLILRENDRPQIPIYKSWRLNERHYGALTGMNKQETAKKFGEQQVSMWRRSFTKPPPPMDKVHPYYKDIVYDVRYNQGPEMSRFPSHESLEMTVTRTLPFWDGIVVPSIRAGKQVLIVAHGNSLRGIIKHLEQMSEDRIVTVNIPTAMPFVYTLNYNMKPMGGMKYLGDECLVNKAMQKVKSQSEEEEEAQTTNQ